ncbi:mycofactocin-associated electron transfer flavoprotein beta subunit [Streptomyces sp. NBC_00557]|uniref:mycofactocin-associated electron transfer flavoprotein beta subunit n=1 Tax=Streptomyces sp. NBC_00557 TaxID=2975776 RepID=UPI002E7FCD73|nr:mycofactocin-associated electron transfer flavoprotein beta subunit [Streptomyces sp. NBC_00557]WUC40200.1 mycofactocin-associated electron transfer flavoprotein beta subunit [Streptomyces sp. NBC_00557]
MSDVLVAAALRWTDSRAFAHPLTGTAPSAPYAAGASPADRCALEHALRLAERLGGRCLAVTVGPVGAEEMLREALAAGADEALRVDGPDGDEAATAHSLLAGLTARGPLPQVVVCGDRSLDRGTGATPALLAHLSGAAQALGLTELTVGEQGAAGASLRAVRRLDGGRAEELRVPLPAVCSVEPGTVRPRRAPLATALAARRAEIAVVRAGAREGAAVRAGRPRPYRPRPRALSAPEGGTRQRLLALTGALAPPRTPPRVVIPGSPEEAAELLLAELREHGVHAPVREA